MLTQATNYVWANNEITCFVATVIWFLPLWGPLSRCSFIVFRVGLCVLSCYFKPWHLTLFTTQLTSYKPVLKLHIATNVFLAFTTDVTLPSSIFQNPYPASTFFFALWYKCDIIPRDDPLIQPPHYRWWNVLTLVTFRLECFTWDFLQEYLSITSNAMLISGKFPQRLVFFSA